MSDFEKSHPILPGDTDPSELPDADVRFTENGTWLYRGREYPYKLALVGHEENARYARKYVVLTDNPERTYDEVNYSILSSYSPAQLEDTVIIGSSLLHEE